MDWLLDLGYFGLFLGSFIAATVVPFSSDVQLIAMLAVGGNVWLCVGVATHLIGWVGSVNGSGSSVFCILNTKPSLNIKVKSTVLERGSLY